MADHVIKPVGFQPIAAFNSIGQVVGTDYVNGWVGATYGITPRKIFTADLGSDGQLINKRYIDTPFKNAKAISINDTGQILGSFDDEDGKGEQYFYSENGEFKRLPLSYQGAISLSYHRIINNAGQIAAGQYIFNPDGNIVTLADPNAAPGAVGGTTVIGLNNDGIVLGQYNQPAGAGYKTKFFTYNSSTGVYTDLPADLVPEAINTSGVFGSVKGGGYVFEGFDGTRVASDYSPADGHNTPTTLLTDWVYFNTGGYALKADGTKTALPSESSDRGPYWEIPVDPADYDRYSMQGDERDDARVVAVNDKGQILAEVDHKVASDNHPSYKPVLVESFDILETTKLPPRGSPSIPKTPIIQGTVGGQTTLDEAPLRPFAHVTIGDPNVGATDTLTITLRDGGGALADGPGQSGLTQIGPGSYRLKAGTPAQLTDELQALVFTPTAGAGGPGATSTTLFELLLASSAGPTAGDRTTTVYDTVRNGAGTAGGPAGGGSSGGGSGSSGGGGSSGTGVIGPQGDAPSGGGSSAGSGSSSPSLTPPTNNTADPTNPTVASGPTTITTTGILGEPYVTSVDRYDRGVYQGSTLLNPNGKVYLESITILGFDGSSTHSYTGGSFFRRKVYSAFTDSYAADGTLTQHAESNRDGTHNIEVYADGQTVQGLGADIVTDYAASTRFVFGPGLGAETIHGFQVSGRGHDTLDLASDAGKLAQILAHATGNGQGDTTLRLGHGDTITLTGVGITELKHHKNDFAFHA